MGLALEVERIIIMRVSKQDKPNMLATLSDNQLNELLKYIKEENHKGHYKVEDNLIIESK